MVDIEGIGSRDRQRKDEVGGANHVCVCVCVCVCVGGGGGTPRPMTYSVQVEDAGGVVQGGPQGESSGGDCGGIGGGSSCHGTSDHTYFAYHVHHIKPPCCPLVRCMPPCH